MPRADRRRPPRVVVVAPQQVELARPQLLDAGVPARVHPPLVDEERDARVVELAVGKRRAEMADVAPALADEDLQTALRRIRIPRNARRIAAQERIAKFVERRAPARQRLLECGERLADADQYRLVFLRHRTEHLAVAARKVGIATHERGHLRGAQAHLARVEQWPDALRPQAVVRPIPAEPPLQPRVLQAGRVAVDARKAERARLAVGPVALGNVAARARHRAVRRQPPLEEQPLAQLDRVALSRDAVRGIGRERRRPRPVRRDRARLRFGERQRRGRERGENRDERAPHSTLTGCAARSVLPSARSSNTSSQRPGIWNSSPSARKRPPPSAVIEGR